MVTERSDTVYGYWREASEKFDYFITGLTGAAVTFIAERMEPMAIGWNSETIELGALLILLVSLVLGFKRIEANVYTFGLMHKRLYNEEIRGALRAEFQGGSLLNASTGEVLSPGEIQRKDARSGVAIKVFDELTEESAGRSSKYYVWRNRFLVAGIAVLILSRVLAAYL